MTRARAALIHKLAHRSTHGFTRLLKSLLALAVLPILLALASPAHAQRVAFINPGLTGEAFWTSAARAMEAAAKDLGMTLEVLWAERQFPKAMELARTIAQRPAETLPDVVIVVNEGGAGPEMVRLLAPRTKVFVAFSGIDAPAEFDLVGRPRERFPNWIGSLEPVAEQAGHQVAQELIRKAREAGLRGPDGRIHLLAISGDRSTPTSVLRSQGMRRAVREAGDVVLDQEVFANFRRDRALEVAQVLFERHPAARVVWAGSDQMAFGAMAALPPRGLTPGRDVLFGGINTSAEAMQALREGRLAALSGGHFILGAWAMVLIHDHLRGADFAAVEGLRIQAPMFTGFTPATAEIFTRRFGGDDFSGVDFSRFSKVRNPGIARYAFGFDPLLR